MERFIPQFLLLFLFMRFKKINLFTDKYTLTC